MKTLKLIITLSVSLLSLVIQLSETRVIAGSPYHSLCQMMRDCGDLIAQNSPENFFLDHRKHSALFQTNLLGFEGYGQLTIDSPVTNLGCRNRKNNDFVCIHKKWGHFSIISSNHQWACHGSFKIVGEGIPNTDVPSDVSIKWMSEGSYPGYSCLFITISPYAYYGTPSPFYNRDMEGLKFPTESPKGSLLIYWHVAEWNP